MIVGNLRHCYLRHCRVLIRFLKFPRFSADSYQAVEIASPATVVQLRLNVIDMDSKPPRSLIKDKVYNVDLDSGSTSDELGSWRF